MGEKTVFRSLNTFVRARFIEVYRLIGVKYFYNIRCNFLFQCKID